MFTFYPGPSRIYDEVPKILNQGFREGIFSMNHRSEPFMKLVAKTKQVLRKNLKIPANYEIIFLSSATESWEIFGQSMVAGKSQHFYNGAFGEKWADYAEKLGVSIKRSQFDFNKALPLEQLDTSAEWICYTQNETSIGTHVNKKLMRMLQESKGQDQLIAVDATSSLGGIELDFEGIDFLFASVQKCLGLPPGLGILVTSPRAIEKAQAIGERNHYNSFLSVLDHSLNNQTHYTPNIPGIFLLQKTQKRVGSVSKTQKKLRERMKEWEKVIDKLKDYQWLVEDKEFRSPTVLALKCANPGKLKKAAFEHSIILGNGYGKWKNETFRIANFPAIKKKEIKYLINFLETVKSA